MNLSAFQSKGKYGFRDDKDNIVIQPAYDEVNYFQEGLCIIRSKESYGVINAKGEIVVPLKYDEIRILSSNLIGVRLNHGIDWDWKIINIQDNSLLEGTFKYIQRIEEYIVGYAEANCLIKASFGKGRMGYDGAVYDYKDFNGCSWINKNGSIVHRGEAAPRKGFLIATYLDELALINCDGQKLLSGKYKNIYPFASGYSIVVFDGDDNCLNYAVINNGTAEYTIAPDTKPIFSDSGILFVKESEQQEVENLYIDYGKYNSHDNIGEWYNYQGKAIYEGSAGIIGTRFLRILKDNNYGVLDCKGEEIISFLYNDVVYLNESFCVSLDNNIGLLDTNGRIIVPILYKNIECVNHRRGLFHEGFETYRYGSYCPDYVYDTKGCAFDWQGKRIDCLQRIEVSIIEGKKHITVSNSHLFDLTKWFILRDASESKLFSKSTGIQNQYPFDYIEAITDISFVVGKENKYGVFRPDLSKFIIPVTYERLIFEGLHTVLMQKDGLWGASSIVDESHFLYSLLCVKIPCKYEEIDILNKSFFEESLYGVKTDLLSCGGEYVGQQYLILNRNGETIKGGNSDLPKFDSNFQIFKQDRVLTSSSGKFGFISLDGYISIPFKYDEIEIRKDKRFNIRIDSGWGILSIDGREIFPALYAEKFADHFNRLIVSDAMSGHRGIVDYDGNIIIPTIYQHLIDSDDYVYFGHGGYEDKDLGSLFSENIRCASWGCLTKQGVHIIPPRYDYFRPIGNYICAGRDGGFAVEGQWGYSMHEIDYAGVYDLYNAEGELIFGGFNKFFTIDGLFFFHFGGTWKEEADEYDYVSSYFVEGNGRWLILNTELQSVIRLKDGSVKKFEKGFQLTITTKKEGIKTTHYWNAPLEIFSIIEPRKVGNLLVIGNHNKERVLCLNDGFMSSEFHSITVLSDSIYACITDNQISIYNRDCKLIDKLYLVITQPVDGYFFGVNELDEKYSQVDFIKIGGNNIKVNRVISQIETTDILRKIQFGFLKLSVSNQDGNECFKVFRPEIFDEEFRNETVEDKELFQSRNKVAYWISDDYRLGDDNECSYDSNDCDDYDYMRDSWDAMTDGMYGDMPEGFDGDYDFLGH